MTDRYIAPGLWNYAVRPGGTVRFYASSRGAKADGTMPSTGELWLWLKNAGFDGTELRLWPLSAGRPVDWPSEDPDKLPPPMEPDAIIFRGEGRWAKSDLPTAIEMQLGPRIQFWMVWQHEERGSARVSGDGRNGPLRFGVFLSLLFGAGIAVSRTAHKQLKR